MLAVQLIVYFKYRGICCKLTFVYRKCTNEPRVFVFILNFNKVSSKFVTSSLQEKYHVYTRYSRHRVCKKQCHLYTQHSRLLVCNKQCHLCTRHSRHRVCNKQCHLYTRHNRHRVCKKQCHLYTRQSRILVSLQDAKFKATKLLRTQDFKHSQNLLVSYLGTKPRIPDRVFIQVTVSIIRNPIRPAFL